MLLLAACATATNPDGWAPPKVADDVLYVSLDSGELSAIDTQPPDDERDWTFTNDWKFPELDEELCGDEEPQKRDLRGIYAAPVVSAGIVYIGAWDGNVYALDAATGRCEWDFETGDPIIGGLTLAGDRLFAASTDGNLYAIDPATGDELDRVNAGQVWSRPTLADGVLYVANVGGVLRAFDAETLAEIWDEPFSVSAGLLTNPVVSEGIVVVGGIGGELYGVDAATGAENWSFSASNWFWGTPVVEGGTIYATSLDKSVYAINLADGEPAWPRSASAENPLRAGPVVSEGVVIAVDEKGLVYRFDTLDGTSVFPAQDIKEGVHADPYVLGDGSVMIIARNGDVFVADPKEGVPEEAQIRP